MGTVTIFNNLYTTPFTPQKWQGMGLLLCLALTFPDWSLGTQEEGPRVAKWKGRAW